MKEFEVSLTKALSRGLRPFPETPDNPIFLEECFNLMPSELALRPHESLTNIDIPTSTPVFPWPRLLVGETRTFLAYELLGFIILQRVLYQSGVWSVLGPAFNLGTEAEIVQIDFADFGAFCVFSTLNNSGFVKTFTLSPDNNTLLPFASPFFGSCCNFRQQLVAGNLPGLPNHVVWSGIGNFEFNPAVDLTAGSATELFPHSSGAPNPYIFKVLKLQDGPVIYSDAGKIILLPDEAGGHFTYGKVPLAGLGIGDLNHVAGDEYIHGFIDLNNDFWILENSSFRIIEYSGGKLTKRGYRSQITDMIAEYPALIVSYIPRDQRFYISNGSRCLLINKFGACNIHQIVFSAIETFDKRLFGIFTDTLDREARVTVEATDFNARGIKTVESAIGGIIHDLPRNQSFFAADWSMTNDDDWHAGRWVTGGPRGEAALRTSALAFKVRCKIDEYFSSQIQSLDVNVKFPDNRFRRGVAAQTTGEQRQNQEQGQ